MLSKKESILLWGSNIWYLSTGMLGPLFAVFTQRVGGNILDITTAWSAYLIVMGVGIMAAGKIVDRFPSKKLHFLLTGYAINTAFVFGYLFVSSPFELLLVQIGFGLGNTLSTPSWSALYDEHSADAHDGFTWGSASGQAAIASGIAMSIGGFIVAEYSFEMLFVTMGVLQLAALFYTARLFRA